MNEESKRGAGGGPQQPEGSLPEGDEVPPPGVRVMAWLRWAIVAVVIVVAALAWFGHSGFLGSSSSSSVAARYHCPMHPSVISDQPSECPICGMDLVPIEEDRGSSTTYTCPMHPEVRTTDPNERCPDCGMRLEPIREPANQAAHAQGGSGAGTSVSGMAAVELSQERVQLVGMRTADVKSEELVAELRTVGFVSARENGLARIHTRFSGWIEELAIDETGQRVDKNQVLARIYSPELLATQQELLAARRWGPGQTDSPRLPTDLVSDAKRKLILLGISPEEIATIERSGEPMRAVPIRSPVRGHIIRKSAVQGAFVEPGTELFEVADLSSVWIFADVYELEASRLKAGLFAHLSFASYPGEMFEGTVQFVYPTMDPSTRTLRARIELQNPELRLLPGMYGDVVLELQRTKGLSIPREAVVHTGELQYVFVKRGEGRFEPRRVQLGMRSGEKMQVLSGLSEGETVVTTGNFLIDSESRLRAALEQHKNHEHR